MNIISRTITGGVFFICGLFLIFVEFFNFFMFLFGFLVMVLGVYVMLNHREDEIEQIKEKKSLKGGKKE